MVTEKRKRMMGWTIIILMSLSVFGYIGGSYFSSLSQNSNTIEYNGMTFVPQGDGHLTTINGNQYFFLKLPSGVGSIAVPVDLSSMRSSERVYLTYPIEQKGNVSLSYDFMSRVLALNSVASQEVCLEEEGCGDLPILDCSVHTALIFEIASETKMRADGRCLYLQGSDVLELQTLAERVAYTLLGVLA